MNLPPSLKDASERRSRMLATARAALAEDRIVPFYQPKVDLQAGRTVGWEALLRIRGTDGEILPPSAIEAAFSDADISLQLTDRMLSLVFADIAAWRADKIDIGRVAVNISAEDFRQSHASGLVERLRSHADFHTRPLTDIELEVTEGVFIGQLASDVSGMLDELRALGVLIALDDFGTGYASLTHLRQFPVDVIKIDRSFVERIDGKDPKSTAVIDAILQMAKRLGIQTVAEGIETKHQAQYLRMRGCSTGQGYLFSRPVGAAEVTSLLASLPNDRWEFGRAGAANDWAPAANG